MTFKGYGYQIFRIYKNMNSQDLKITVYKKRE